MKLRAMTPTNFINETGNRYDRILVVARARNTSHGASRWLCKCDCGNWLERAGYQMRSDYKRYGKACCVECRNTGKRTDDPIRLRRFLQMGASSGPCTDCGMWPEHPCIMDFDHLYAKSRGMSNGWNEMTTPELVAEISKCDLVCSNCHRLRTFNYGKWAN